MHRIALAVAPFVAFALAAPAHAAESGPYLSLSVASATNNELTPTAGFKISLDDAKSYAGAIGWDFGALRAEIEARRVSGSTNIGLSVQGEATSVMAVGYVEPVQLGAIQPYLLAGYGQAHGSMHLPFGTGVSKSGKAYQFGGGVGVSLSKNIMLDASYRRLDSSDLAGFKSDLLGVGLRVKLA